MEIFGSNRRCLFLSSRGLSPSGRKNVCFRRLLGTEFVFSLHDARMKCHSRTRIIFGLKTGKNSFTNYLYGNEISSQYHVNRYSDISGDRKNSFWNESHSGTMKQPLILTYFKVQSTLHRFQTKTVPFCVHTYRFRIVFGRPHYNSYP